MQDNTVNNSVLSDEEIRLIKKDRMRFSLNKLSSTLTIIAIVFNALYFISIYKSNVKAFYYKPIIGVSVVYNLLFMLIAFLCSEGIKNYKEKFGYVLVAIGVMQVVRIFYFPLKAQGTEISEGVLVMETAQFIRTVVYLALSAASLISAGVIGVIRSKTLQNYRKTLGEEKPA